ncbi:hypothetical protein [Nonomuraea sp. NPDC049646]|uniref:hypothetical protein n=1 Tax=unclassified Nonomuraea TaxID=2593643 RepID=UPI00378BF883
MITTVPAVPVDVQAVLAPLLTVGVTTAAAAEHLRVSQIDAWHYLDNLRLAGIAALRDCGCGVEWCRPTPATTLTAPQKGSPLMSNTSTAVTALPPSVSTRAFRVAVRDDTDTVLGFLGPTPLLAEVRETLTRVQRAYPRSILQALLDDGDLGDWRDVTDDDLDRIADVTAARALANLLTIPGMPRISWFLSNGDAGELSASADSEVQLNAYAAVLGLHVEETETSRSTLVCAKGTFQGVAVRVTCYRRTSEAAGIEVKA